MRNRCANSASTSSVVTYGVISVKASGILSVARYHHNAPAPTSPQSSALTRRPRYSCQPTASSRTAPPPRAPPPPPAGPPAAPPTAVQLPADGEQQDHSHPQQQRVHRLAALPQPGALGEAEQPRPAEEDAGAPG